MAALIPNNRNRKRTFSECDPVAHQQIVGFLVTAFNSCKDKIPFLERDFTKSSMILPTEYNNAVIPYVYEKPMLDVLERKGVINWNRNIRALLTMFADDDGNSLAHSVSLYIFGIQDKEHHLRQLIYQMMFMQKPNNESEIYARWIHDRDVVLSKLHPIRSPYYDEESKRNWPFYLGKPQQRRDCSTQKFASLDAIHIFVLCNVIGRPIIVYTDANTTNGGYDVTDGIRYEGVYLPVLRAPNSCEKSPVLIGFDSGRFVPLFSTENQNLDVFTTNPHSHSQHCAPLIRKDFSKIPIRFLSKQEQIQPDFLLQKYFDLVLIPTTEKTPGITAAILKFKAPNAQCIQLLWSMLEVVMEYEKEDTLMNIQYNDLPIQQQNMNNQFQNFPQQHKNIPPNNMPNNQFQNMSLQPNMVDRDVSMPQQNEPFQQPRSFPNQQQQMPRPCARQKANLCRKLSNASNRNNQGMCDECYDQFMSVHQNIKQRRNKSTPQLMPQGAPFVQQQQQNPLGISLRDGYDHLDTCVKCYKEKAIKDLDGMCKFCYKDSILLQNKIEEQPYESLGKHVGPLPLNNQQNINSKQPQGNCNHCGVKYFQVNEFGLCEECFEKIKRQQEEVEHKKSFEKAQPKPVAPYQNGSGRMGVGSSLPIQGGGRFPVAQSFDSQGGKGSYYGNVGSGIPRQGASAGLGSGDLGFQGSGYHGGVGRFPVAQSFDSQGGKGFYHGNVGSEFPRQGASAGLGSGDLGFQGSGYHGGSGGSGYQGGSGDSSYQGRGSSGYQGAAGNADYHDADNRKEQEKIRKKTLCSVPGCLDHVRGINEKVCEQHFKKENKLCWACEKNQADDNVHGVCIYCLATQGNLIKEVQQEQEKKGKNNNKGPIPQNLNIARGPANIGAPPNMGMADNIGIDLESLPDLPQMVPRGSINQFNPPTAYEGFANREQNYGGQQGQLPWQQQRINERKCRSCNNAAAFNSLCMGCYNRNTAGQQPQPNGVKCGNPDKPGCKNLVYNSDHFMCQECILEQRAGMEKVFKNEQQQQLPPMQQQHQFPPMQERHFAINVNPGQECITRGCSNKLAQESDELCGTCKQGQFPNFPHGLPQPQVAAQMAPRQQGFQAAPPTICKAFDCDFNASPEYGGYCHKCFMMVSKHQAEKDNAHQQLMPQPQQQHFDIPVPQTQPGLVKYVSEPCRNPDCNMYGRPEQNGLCSKCFKLNKTERD